jgi:4-amino-4-deoxy-L-arabinose transferase-like glycosyltransferase
MNDPQPSTHTGADNRSAWDLVACVAIVFFLVTLTWFGAEYHYVEMCYSTEYDRYVEQADQLLQGVLPKDPFHPLFYPLLSAAAGKVLGDTFAGARTISTFAAAGLLSLTYLLGILCFGRKTAALATLALALNSLVFMCGFEAGTDMLFAFLGLGCLLLCVRLQERPVTSVIVGMGICLALAYFTRYAALALIPCVIMALWRAPFPSETRRWVGGAILVVTVVICLVPHFLVNIHLFGNPLHMRQGDNLVRKVRLARPDLVSTAPDTVHPARLLIAAPLVVARATLDTTRTWIVDGVAGFIGGNRVFLASALFSVALLGGLVVSVVKACHGLSVLLLFAATYFVLICVSMEPLPRLFLPILPVGMLVAVFFLAEGAPSAIGTFKGIPVTVGTAAITLFLVLLPWGAFHAVSDMVPRHPYREVEAAQGLERIAGKHVVVSGTFPFMQRYVGYRYVHLTNDFGNAGPRERHEFFGRLGAALKGQKADYLVVGAPSLGSRPVELLTGKQLPPYLHPELMEEGLSVYRVLKDKL